MAPRPGWTGAIMFAGFPIHVRAYPLVKSKSSDSFKTLAPTDKLPVAQQLVDGSGAVVERAECLKGHEVSKGKFVALDPAAVEMIRNAEATPEIDPERFAPLDTVPLHLASGHFALRPNEKVPGAEGPVGILWNGLRASERALITKWVPRAGARDGLVAITATESDLHAHQLPFADELAELPAYEFEENEQAAQMFDQFVGMNYPTDPFDHAAFESDYLARRQAAIDAALKGETIEAPKKADDGKLGAPDLMAAMAAAVQGGTPRSQQAAAYSGANAGRKGQVAAKKKAAAKPKVKK